MLKSITKWILLSVIIGILVGSASAIFLYLLNLVTEYRESNLWIIALLPLAGGAIGWSYKRWGDRAVKGNNLIIEEYYIPKKNIPFVMAPLVLITTLLTHLFGGSAGREGTAVQIGGAIADQFAKPFKLNDKERRTLLICGVSAGFASLFGTPLAGAVFAIEVMMLKRFNYKAIIPSVLIAYTASYTTSLWGASHTIYPIPQVVDMNIQNGLWTILAGIAFGLTAILFVKTHKYFTKAFNRIKNPIYRPMVGGVIIAGAVFLIGTSKYIGLGIPTIISSFETTLPYYDFIVKLIFTTLTLACGFKGGEVTPLFFIGAALGNALAIFIPLPISLLAAMGFVGVFAGATNTPIACFLMGLELFGIDVALYLAIACVIAYLFSGMNTIYASQDLTSSKSNIYRI